MPTFLVLSFVPIEGVDQVLQPNNANERVEPRSRKWHQVVVCPPVGFFIDCRRDLYRYFGCTSRIPPFMESLFHIVATMP